MARPAFALAITFVFIVSLQFSQVLGAGLTHIQQLGISIALSFTGLAAVGLIYFIVARQWRAGWRVLVLWVAIFAICASLALVGWYAPDHLIVAIQAISVLAALGAVPIFISAYRGAMRRANQPPKYEPPRNYR